MLNQALTEIQSALDVLSQMADSQQTVGEGVENLEIATNKVNEAIAILQNVEHSFKEDKLTIVSSDSHPMSDQSDYYEETLQKIA